MQNYKSTKIALQKYWMKQSFFPHSAFRLPTLIICFFILSSGIAWGLESNKNEDAGSLAVSLDKESVKVGGIVWLTLDYRLPEGGRLPEKPAVKGLEGITVLTQTADPGRIRIQLLVDQVDPWRSETIGLEYLDSKGRTQNLTAGPVSLQVESNLGEKPEEAQLRPISDIIAVSSIWRRFLLWGAALAALILIGLGAYRWFKKRQRPATALDAEEAPHVRARRAIEKLAIAGYFEKGMVKTHYFVFSEILRRYLESIRHFPAVEYTTEEISQHIRSEQDSRLLSLLKRADLVKFADDVPTTARKEEDIQVALAYIRETGPASESTAAAGRRPEVQP